MCICKECVFYSLGMESSVGIKSIWSNVSFKASVSLLIFCLDDLSIDVSGVLKSPTLIVLLSVSPFMTVNICFIYLGASVLGVYMFMSVTPSSWIDPFIVIAVPFFVFCYRLCFKINFIWCEYCYLSFLLVSICMEYLSIPSLSISLCLSLWSESLVGHVWVRFLCPFSHSMSFD